MFCKRRVSGSMVVITADQAMRAGIVEDVGGFDHFHHESRAASRQVVAGADAGENAVDGADLCLLRRYEAAGVGEQHNQRALPHIR